MPVTCCGYAVSHDRGDEAAPVAALHAEALVAEHVRHQLRIDVGDVLNAEPLLPRLERQRVARQRRRDNREMFGEQRDQLVELEHRSGPAVGDQQRHGVGLARRLVDEMQVDAADRHRELPEAVELGFPGAPVEACAPVVGKLLRVRHAGSGRPRLQRRLVGPARAREAVAQVGDVGVGDLEGERLRRHDLSSRNFASAKYPGPRSAQEIRP